jgi:hypothetical protein
MSGIVNSSQFQFTWSDDNTVNQNFTEWYILNSEERSAYSEPMLEKDQAIKIFEDMYDVSVDKS